MKVPEAATLTGDILGTWSFRSRTSEANVIIRRIPAAHFWRAIAVNSFLPFGCQSFSRSCAPLKEAPAQVTHRAWVWGPRTPV
jgi:hypothetical protein